MSPAATSAHSTCTPRARRSTRSLRLRISRHPSLPGSAHALKGAGSEEPAHFDRIDDIEIAAGTENSGVVEAPAHHAATREQSAARGDRDRDFDRVADPPNR